MINFIPGQVLTAEELNAAFAEVSLTGSQMLITPHSFVGDGLINSFPLTVTPFSLDYVIAQVEDTTILSNYMELSNDTPPYLSFNTPQIGNIEIRVISAIPAEGGGGVDIIPHIFTSTGGRDYQLTVSPIAKKYVNCYIGPLHQQQDAFDLTADVPPKVRFDDNVPTGLVVEIFVTQTSGGVASSGDMTKAVYDPDEDGKIAYAQTSGVQAELSNATTLGKITEAAELPLWKGAAWPSTSGPGGTTDHGALSGLEDDDHSQYFNLARGDLRYMQSSGLAAAVLGTVLAGLSLASTTAVTATDSILVAIGKLQAKITSLITNGSFTNPTITDYIETVYAPAAGTAFTVDLANGTKQKLTTSGNATIALPTPVAGKSFVLLIAYGGAHTVTWTGGGTIKWAGGTAPTATSVSGKFDRYVFDCYDTTNTFAADGGRNF